MAIDLQNGLYISHEKQWIWASDHNHRDETVRVSDNFQRC